MLLVVLVGAFNAIARYLGKSLGRDLSSNAYLELQWYLFGLIFLLSGAYTLQRNAHVRVDVLYDRLPRRMRAWIDTIGHVVLLLPFAVFAVVVSLGPVADSWKRGEQSPDPGGLPRYPIKVIVPIAFALLALQGIGQLIKQIRELRDAKEEAEGNGAPQEQRGPQ
jgi:TRAP-type mannitol/chloroaromatic compound transport system permease small subunit